MIDSPYIYKFDPDGDSTAARVVRNVGNEKYVLELGCAYGVMTKALVEHNNCRVFGIEFDEKSAQHAKPYCEDLHILDIENSNWDKVFGDARFDVILAADVLEHLRDPRKCLVSLRKYLKPDGYIVLSIPNIAHNGIISELLIEDFRYRETGLLDSTHLRFWGAEGIRRLLSDTGFLISNLEMTRVEPELSEFADSWASLPEWFKTELRARPDGNVYQYIIKIFPKDSKADFELMPWSVNPTLISRDEIERRINEAEKKAEAIEQTVEVISNREVELNALVHQMVNSASWRMTRPLRFAARLVRYGITNQDSLRITQSLRYRYHNLMLPAPVKKLIRLAYNNIFRKFVRLHRSVLRVGQFHAPTIKPASKTIGLPDYILWGVIDWHFRHQRPQQLALALANTGRRVFYISPNFTDDERKGFEVEPLDSAGLLFQVKLFVKGAPVIYSSAPGVECVSQLRASIGEMLNWASSQQLISLVQHPFWQGVASVLPNSCLVYDCMDHHDGFDNNAESLLQLEKSLLQEAELTITTSTWLDSAVAPHAKQRALIRNAGDFDHFGSLPDSIYRDPQGRRIIGYYGAIAEWFDLDLVEAVARQNAECCVLLIGADTVNAKSRLGKLPNVTFTGEVPYCKLPHYLYSFDVCLLPFKVIPLTLATNPVKVYEFLGAGKPVVTVDLPEIAQFGDLVYATTSKDTFLAAVSKVLSLPEAASLFQQRKAFAKGQTWEHRAQALISHAESTNNDPKVSVIVVTYNNIDLTRECLSSLDEYSQYKNMEIIVVDNSSSDGTPDYLSEWVANGQNRRLILNDDNRGFAAANNQGLLVATGDYLVLLNNDTFVTPGWIRTMVRHFDRDKSIGLLGPVTNNIGNEAKIDITYADMDEMLVKSSAYTHRHIGKTYPLRTVAFFCVMMQRAIYERVGPLDEAFGRGFFEDDDYCRRIEQIGLRIVCAEDVFIHHHLSASFNKLKQVDRQKLFEDNKRIYEAKWGEWLPHTYRNNKS